MGCMGLKSTAHTDKEVVEEAASPTAISLLELPRN